MDPDDLKKLENSREAYLAAVLLQKHIRGFLSRFKSIKFNKENTAAIKIQSAFRNYRMNRVIHHCQEILALQKIRRVVADYLVRLRSRKEFEKLAKFDNVLSYFPSKTKPPPPKPKKGKRRRKRKGGVEVKRTRRDTKELKMQAPMVYSSQSKKNSGVRRKRVTFMATPPPWKNKNPKRLAQTQMEEMMFQQKENLSWTRKNLIPMLLRRTTSKLDERDALLERNTKFMNRKVTKMIVSRLVRGSKVVNVNAPLHMTTVGNSSIFSVGSLSSVATIDVSNEIMVDPSSQKVKFSEVYYDVLVHSHCGFIFVITNTWELKVMEPNLKQDTMKLEVSNRIPHSTKFIFEDDFGMIWVCLFPQGGKLYCIDPITLQIAADYNYDLILSMYPLIRSTCKFLPLCSQKEVIALAFVFKNMRSVNIFTREMSSMITLNTRGMSGLPSITQVGKYLIVYSNKDLYLYEFSDLIHKQPVAKYKSESKIIHVCGTVDPDLIFVAKANDIVTVLLGKDQNIQLRIPDSKLEYNEHEFADRLLGPPRYSESMGLLSEVLTFSLIYSPYRVYVKQFSERVVLFSSISLRGNVSSSWIIIDTVQMPAIQYDDKSFKGRDHTTLSKRNIADINVALRKKTEAKIEFKKKLATVFNFAEKASISQTAQLFSKDSDSTPLSEKIKKVSLSFMFPYIPPATNKTISSYEMFVLLKMIGVLPTAVSSFSEFLDRFVPKLSKRPVLPIEKAFNVRIPAKTVSEKSLIVDVSFPITEIDRIVDLSNPLKSLFVELDKFTISSVNERHKSVELTTRRRWLWDLESTAFSKQLQSLGELEMVVKNEMVRRVYEKITASFKKNLLNKKESKTTFEISDHNFIDCEDKFTHHPNRNPLLYKNIHQSIYESYAIENTYHIEPGIKRSLIKVTIPSRFFENSVVDTHFKFVTRLSRSAPTISSAVYNYNINLNGTYNMIISEDNKSLPLSHYLKIHSFMGGDSRLISGAKLIIMKILNFLQQLHRNKIICRTVVPENVMINESMSSVTIGKLYDSQLLLGSSRSVYLPLPSNFAQPENPFIPPEYYHTPPRRYTAKFDVWQIGIMLLYMITGQLPPAYGAELLKCRGTTKKNKVVIKDSNIFDDPPLYERGTFFYDWLAGFKIVKDGDKCTGEHGECYIKTVGDPDVPASILNLDDYRLLPFKNANPHVDEAKVWIDVIASCLQVDPEKRPTVSELLRTIIFSQQQTSDVLDSYTRNPNPNIFITHFFTPVLSNINDETFPFAIGIISALIFNNQSTDEDKEFSFPLDSHAAEEVIKALFKLNFLDTLAKFVIKRTMKKITVSSIKPTIKFQDSIFNIFYKFFERFVSSNDNRHGILCEYTDEIATTLLALYTGNACMRHTSQYIINSHSDVFVTGNDSAAYFVFTYSKVGKTVKRIFDSFYYSISKFSEHSHTYFNKFSEFAQKVHELSRAICYNIEKQKQNAVKMITQLFADGDDLSTVRLFIDFNVPQKIISLLPLECCRDDCFLFLKKASNAVRLRSTDPTYALLRNCIQAPMVLTFAAIDLRKEVPLSIVDNILTGENMRACFLIVVCDVLWNLFDHIDYPPFRQSIQNAVAYSSTIVLELVMQSNAMQMILQREFMPRINYQNEPEVNSLDDILQRIKVLSSALFIRQGSLPPEYSTEKPPIDESVEFLIKAIHMTLNEATRIAKILDKQVFNDTMFDLRGTVFLKAKEKAKKTNFNQTVSLIETLSDSMLHMFRCLCFYWRDENCDFPKHLFTFIINIMESEIPYCYSTPHPAYYIHECIQKMALYCLTDMPETSPAHSFMTVLQTALTNVFKRDLSFVMICIDRDVAEIQLSKRYPSGKKIRMKLFEAVTSDPSAQISQLLRFIIDDMLHNMTKFVNASPELVNTYPIRSEAESMIEYVFSKKDNVNIPAKIIADELIVTQFIDRERKMIDSNTDPNLVSSSIMLLKSILQSSVIVDEKFRLKVSKLLEYVFSRYTRTYEGIDLAVANNVSIPQQHIAKEKKLQKIAIRSHTALSVRVPPSRPDSARRTSMAPKRSSTTLRRLLNPK